MKKIYAVLAIFCFLSLLVGCSSERANANKKVVAQINKYKMSIDDLKYELKNVPYDDVRLLKTQKGRKDYIDRLIEKEILLQEAQHQGIDKEKDFMKSIENYWEQALLRLLLQRKTKEISGIVYVYDNEIEEYYRNSGETLPLSEVHSDIRRLIRQRKETDLMNAWIEELKKKSYVKIDEDVLEEVIQ